MTTEIEDAGWLLRELLNFFENKLEDKQRFSDMSGMAFAEALMMVWGAYLLNKKATGKNTIKDIEPKDFVDGAK